MRSNTRIVMTKSKSIMFLAVALLVKRFRKALWFDVSIWTSVITIRFDSLLYRVHICFLGKGSVDRVFPGIMRSEDMINCGFCGIFT